MYTDGRCVASGRYFQGILHELLVYDRPLAPTELASATAACATPLRTISTPHDGLRVATRPR